MGVVMPASRRPPTKAVIFQYPCGTGAQQRLPPGLGPPLCVPDMFDLSVVCRTNVAMSSSCRQSTPMTPRFICHSAPSRTRSPSESWLRSAAISTLGATSRSPPISISPERWPRALFKRQHRPESDHDRNVEGVYPASGAGEWHQDQRCHGRLRPADPSASRLAGNMVGMAQCDAAAGRAFKRGVACCMEARTARDRPTRGVDQVTRTEFGRPRSSIRLRTATPMATSAA